MYIVIVWNCPSVPPCIRPNPKITGSVNSCRPPIVATITVNNSVGLSNGTVIRQNCCHGLAPSTAAASYSSLGMACMAPSRISALYPVQRQSTITEIAIQDDQLLACQSTRSIPMVVSIQLTSPTSRTRESFGSRTADRIGATTVADVDGTVAGFVMVIGDEVEQLYVDASHRGSGIATALLTEGERQIAAAGHAKAWLAVAPGNARAIRFYERSGWTDEGVFDYQAEGPDGPFPVPCHRYVKPVS
jgi:ribosomal protein S18 acetylase RimI-like enzyme